MRTFGVGLFTTLLLAACSIGETHYESVTYPLEAAQATRTCDSPFKAVDVSTLEPCGDGLGHCYPESKTAVPHLPACAKSGEVCVPDKVLKANGEKLAACTFQNGKPGACVSLLIGDIAAHKKDLKPDTCDGAIERCAPCISPLDQTDSHLCDPAGVHEEDCVGGTGKRAASCCHGSGTCMDPEAAPEDQRDSLHQDACPSKKVCAPKAMVDGNPSRCYVAALPGVCIDVCFAAMLGPSAAVTRTDPCGPTEVCLPCLIGKGQGMPGCD